ncbi:VanZ family protein [Streptomyces sp. NPDC058735]|uniref:VanZ family protein n=1 Tax=unclassified Streptomyces TaxID=2593676 RepID=UPI0036905826
MVPAGCPLAPVLPERHLGVAGTLMTAAAGLSVEAAQLLSYIVLNNGRSVDGNDLIANPLGGPAGYAPVTLALCAPALRGPLLAAALPRPRRRAPTADGIQQSPTAGPAVRP